MHPVALRYDHWEERLYSLRSTLFQVLFAEQQARFVLGIVPWQANTDSGKAMALVVAGWITGDVVGRSFAVTNKGRQAAAVLTSAALRGQ
jgi:hypothetical protein